MEDSSVGVQVLAASAPPDGFYSAELHGLVDELLVEEDPENDWQARGRPDRISDHGRYHTLT